MMRKACLLLALASLSACGIKGNLERPAPIWGQPGAHDPAPATPPPESEDDDQNNPDALRLPN